MYIVHLLSLIQLNSTSQVESDGGGTVIILKTQLTDLNWVQLANRQVLQVSKKFAAVSVVESSWMELNWVESSPRHVHMAWFNNNEMNQLLLYVCSNIHIIITLPAWN